MEIIDDNGNSLANLTLCLTYEEMAEMRDTLSILLDSHDPGRHEHINDCSFEKAVTIFLDKPNYG